MPIGVEARPAPPSRALGGRGGDLRGQIVNRRGRNIGRIRRHDIKAFRRVETPSRSECSCTRRETESLCVFARNRQRARIYRPRAPSAPGRSLSIDSNKQPLPVPGSAIFTTVSGSGYCASTAATKVSLSGSDRERTRSPETAGSKNARLGIVVNGFARLAPAYHIFEGRRRLGWVRIMRDQPFDAFAKRMGQRSRAPAWHCRSRAAFERLVARAT